MDYEKIVNRLNEYKEELEKLKPEHHSTGAKKRKIIHDKIIMVVRRIYPNSKDVENKFFPRDIWLAGGGDSYQQELYIDKVEKDINAINTISEEFELFGLDNFESVKKKIENETKLGGRDLFTWKRKTTK